MTNVWVSETTLVDREVSALAFIRTLDSSQSRQLSYLASPRPAPHGQEHWPHFLPIEFFISHHYIFCLLAGWYLWMQREGDWPDPVSLQTMFQDSSDA